jgi:hypothetical protein
MRGFGDELELGIEARMTDICLNDGMRSCRSSETAIMEVGNFDT